MPKISRVSSPGRNAEARAQGFRESTRDRMGAAMSERSLELLKGTLDVLILKTLSRAPMHGYGVSRAIRRASGEDFTVDEGALYPALRRLEKRGFVESEWGVTETGRDAKYYRLTEAGTDELDAGLRTWRRYVEAMTRVLEQAAG